MMRAARYAKAFGYYMAARSTAARMFAIPTPVLMALRSRQSYQPQIRGSALFAVEVIRSRGRVSYMRIEESSRQEIAVEVSEVVSCRIDENSEQLRQSHG
jgi:hypothetical protein